MSVMATTPTTQQDSSEKNKNEHDTSHEIVEGENLLKIGYSVMYSIAL
jgi:hypothetical protein